MIASEDRTYLEKLGCDNLIDLAILAPTSFDDMRLYDRIRPGIKQAAEVTVKQRHKTGKNLKVELFCHNLNRNMHAMIFHPKPYHFATFMPGKELTLFGIIEQSSWGISMVQPQKIGRSGEIVANYGSRIRNDTHNRLIREYLTVDALIEEGLPEAIARGLVSVHAVDAAHIEHYNLHGVNDAQLQALKFAEVYSFMYKLSLKRDTFPSLSHIAVSPQPWIASLPFTLTSDQQSAIAAIEQDLKQEESSRRMVVGDVGSGKTMVILATAYMNRDGRTILMAPTTLLAIQLYEEAQKWLPDIKSVLVTNKEGKKADLQAYGFLIGTHALLHRQLPEANVVMIDEQHRFGTKQRNLIQKLVSQDERRPHFFQFSATPIPRTQAMINSALLNVSLIQQTPFKKDISTSVIGKEHFTELLSHIRREISEDRQVLIIYPLVEESETINYQSIDEARGYWEKNFDDVYVTHGKDRDKDEVLLQFRERGKILLATTVVEVGISLPRLSTIVIVGAERLGFATLHQLRGRVSRTGLKGYCYLFTHTQESKRLEEFAKVNNGFDIAALDLRYRHGGDLLSGRRQSGSKYIWFDESSDEMIAREVKALIMAQRGQKF